MSLTWLLEVSIYISWTFYWYSTITQQQKCLKKHVFLGYQQCHIYVKLKLGFRELIQLGITKFFFSSFVNFNNSDILIYVSLSEKL